MIVQAVQPVGPLHVMGLVIMKLARCIIKSGVELLPVVEDALKLIARGTSVGESDLADIFTGQGVDRHQTVFMFAFEASDVVDIIADAFHALVQQKCFFAGQFHVPDRSHPAIENYHIIIVSEPADVAVVFLIVCDGGKALVVLPDRPGQMLHFFREPDRLC